MEVAKGCMKTWHIDLPDPDPAYLPEGTDVFSDYLEAVNWAQRFAKANRQVMMSLVRDVLCSGRVIGKTGRLIDCHHNFVALEHHFGKNLWVTRKGAVRARIGDMAIIPGSMGAKSFIVQGKGNPVSLTSCSHGAGRSMSRNKARETFSLEDHNKATAGIECRKEDGVLDETPGAYKDIDAVMNAQRDLVKIKHILKQLICIKG